MSQINWLTFDSLNVFKLVLNQFQSRLKTIWHGGTDINDMGPKYARGRIMLGDKVSVGMKCNWCQTVCEPNKLAHA